jgi:hypothetical protein
MRTISLVAFTRGIPIITLPTHGPVAIVAFPTHGHVAIVAPSDRRDDPATGMPISVITLNRSHISIIASNRSPISIIAFTRCIRNPSAQVKEPGRLVGSVFFIVSFF